MDNITRDALLRVFGLSEEDVNGIEPDEDVYRCLNMMVEDCNTRSFQHVVQAADAERQATDIIAEGLRWPARHVVPPAWSPFMPVKERVLQRS